MDHTSVHDFDVDMMEDDIAIILTSQRTDPGQQYVCCPICRANIDSLLHSFIEITSLNLQTEISDLELLSRLPKCFYHFQYVDFFLCGEIVAVHLCLEKKVLLVNWRTSSRVVISTVSKPISEIALVPGHLLVLSHTGTRGELRVALSPFPLFECWEPNDSVEQPSGPGVPAADLPFLPDTFSLTLEPTLDPLYAWLRSIWVYENPFQQGRFTVWLHGSLNGGAPTLLSFEFVKHATRVSWRFLSSTVMPAQMDPITMSLSGHTLGRCRGYDKIGIFPPLSVAKDSARRQIVDFWGGSTDVHMSSFSGALTYSTETELVIIYYD
jgi:hypothetical protein